MKGVLRWRITDDEGRVHTFLIKDSYYHKESPYRLVSPQHLAQACYDDGRGTWCGTYRNAAELHWDHNQYKRTIPLNESNIALMCSAPGFDSFVVFATAFEELTEDSSFVCLPMTVSDNEDDSSDEETDPDETRGETMEQIEDREQGKMRRHPDLPDDVFPDQPSVEKDLGEMAPDDEWLKFVDEEDNRAQVHIIPEDEDVQDKSAQENFCHGITDWDMCRLRRFGRCQLEVTCQLHFATAKSLSVRRACLLRLDVEHGAQRLQLTRSRLLQYWHLAQ